MRSSEPWKPPDWLEPAFIYIAFSVAVVAAITLLLWVLITFVIPFNIYSRETDLISLDNGQTLQVEYPNLVLAGETPTYILLVLHGESNATEPAAFTVKVPLGLTVVEPVDQAQSKTVKLTAADLGSATEPTQMKIGVINSRSLGGILLFVRKPLVIGSSFLTGTPPIEVGIETIPWTAARTLVNSTINERSTLILLVTGFLSGAGTLVLQYMKTHRDRAREDRQKKENEFHKQMDENFLETLNRFVNLDQDTQEESDFSIYKRLVKSCDWENKLQRIILENLIKDVFEAKRAADVFDKLGKVYGQKDEYKYLIALCNLCNLASIDDPKKYELTDKEAEYLLTTSKRWQELKPVVTGLIYEFTELAENLPVINNNLAPHKNGQLLRDANIQKIIDKHLVELADGKRGYKALLKAAENINKLLILDIQWRDIWSGKERKPSDKVQRWLSGHWYESGSVEDNISLGSEFAELDNKLMALLVDHTAFKQIDSPSPTIVFGDEGTGKTASALWLMDKYQKSAKADSRESKVFPVYAPFEPGVDIKEWLVEKVSRALIDFTADNPRRFLTAPESQKAAMGRLMLRHAQTESVLRINFYSSPFNSAASDIEQVLDHIKEFKHKNTTTKLTKEETLNVLYMARPDTFDQIYLLWDIRSTAPQEEVVNKIIEMEGMAVFFARQNIFIKIFAPLTTKESLSDHAGLHPVNSDLIWDQSQLRELIEKRIRMFDALGERGLDDPAGLVLASAKQSPRGVIRFLVCLMDYVDQHLQEGQKLKSSDFEQVRFRLSEKK